MNDNNDKFTENIRSVLDQSLDDLDADLKVKLSRLKYRALDSAAQKKSWKLVWGSVPLTAVLLLIVLFNLPQPRQIQVASPDLTTLNILTATESLDFYAEDIEFYEWLSEVMENEQELSGQRTSVPVNPDSDNSPGTGNGQNTIAQSGTDRVSWSIRG
ncbi:MAG: hypothetical protein PF441_07530 [Desulfuromusa sp.]|jgi:hypothetical protein|nr:hypothetical protein [Desulfuromusa sp.]